MANEELLGVARNAAGAILFMQAGMTVMDAFSGVNSSPWTAENFGGDPSKAASCREYVAHAVVISNVYCLTAGVVAKSWWPIVGMLLGDAYMIWLYERALARGTKTGSTQWGSTQANQ